MSKPRSRPPHHRTLVAALFWCCTLALGREPARAQTTFRVLAAGDSITQGFPDRSGGFRRHWWAWRSLVGRFVFVGTLGRAPLQHFAIHHCTTGCLSAWLAAEVRTVKPDLVALQIGKNDILQALARDPRASVNQVANGVLKGITACVDAIYEGSRGSPAPPIVLIHPLIATGSPAANRIVQAVNARLIADVALPRLRRGQLVWVVPVAFPVLPSELIDGVHPDPNKAGFRKLAADWVSFLLGAFR